MENNKDKSYPADYEHVGKKVADAQQQINQLDQQINQVPKNSTPAPRLKPPGFLEPKRFNHERQVAALKDQQTQIKDGTIKEVAHEVKEADPKTARQVRERTLEAFYPNPFKKMTVAEKNKQHSQPKDINQSQDYMDAMFKSASPKPDKETDKTQEKTMPSMSLRFSQGLSYTKAQMKTDKSPDHGKDKDMDRD